MLLIRFWYAISTPHGHSSVSSCAVSLFLSRRLFLGGGYLQLVIMASKLFRSLKSRLAGDKAAAKVSPAQSSSNNPATKDVDPNTIICSIPPSSALVLSIPEDPKTLPELSEVQITKNANIPTATFGNNVINYYKVYIVVSILSGNQLASPFQEKILAVVFQKLNISKDKFEIIHTTDSNTITNLTKDVLLPQANKGHKQLVILLSGDGGIVDILNALSPRTAQYVSPEVSLIPMGTGNALANSSGLGDPTFGLSTLIRGQPRDLPMFKVTFSPGARLLTDEARKEEELASEDGVPSMYGAVVCSWGMHAGLVADSDTAEYRKFGIDRFKMAAKEALYPEDGSPPHPYKAKVTVLLRGSTEWTETPRTEHAYVLTTLVSSLEKGFTISPHSKPLDPTMRIVHFGPMAGDEIMALMSKAYQGGKHVDEEVVSYQEVEKVRVSFEGREDDGRWRRICVDGKIVRVESDGWVEVTKEESSILSLRYLER
jgi:diacylglycerol kinase family enzyme